MNETMASTPAEIPPPRGPSAMDATMEADASEIPVSSDMDAAADASVIVEEKTAIPSDEDAPDELAGTIVAGRYKMEHELGRGGFAVVYKAFDENLEKEVAIKRLLPKALEGREGARMRERFRNEAKAIARASTNGLFMKNSACCGTLVSCRFGLCSSGLAKSKSRKVLGRNFRSMRP